MAEGWSVTSLSHFTLAVGNLERSVEFYSMVGFQMIDDRRDAVWASSTAENLGLARAQGRGVLMAIDAGAVHTRLDLIEWLEPRLPPPPSTPVTERVPQLIALLTENVPAAYADLSGRGVAFTVMRDDEEHHRIGIKGVAVCRDPDDNLVEFIEYMPGLRNSQPNKVLPRRASTA